MEAKTQQVAVIVQASSRGDGREKMNLSIWSFMDDTIIWDQGIQSFIHSKHLLYSAM